MKRRDFLKTPAAAALTPAGAEPQSRPATRAGQPEWRANWIWTPFCPGVNYKTLNQQQARNSYFYARRTFELPAAPAKAVARVSADSRYTLFINGQRIGFGPARCDPRRQCYDVYEREIIQALKPGTNVVAALVHHIGESTFSYILGRSGFLFEAEVETARGNVQLQTDYTWKVLPGLPWQYVPHRLSLQTDFPEIYDARLEPAGWNTVDFDDSSWNAPRLIGPPPVAPWGEMVRRDIPFFAEKDVFPAAAIATGESIAMEREFVFDTHAIFGRPEVRRQRRLPTSAEIRAEIHSPSAQEAWFVIGYTNPYEVVINGTTVKKSAIRQGGDSGHMVKHQLPSVPLNQGRNELSIRFELNGRIQNLFFGHLGPADALGYRNWTAEPGVNRQTEIAALQQTERVLNVARPPGPVVRIEPGTHDKYLLLDFGKEVFGYPQLKIRSAGDGIIDLGYSELLVDGRAAPNKSGLSNADRYLLRSGAQSWQTFEKRAFRYMQLDFRKLTAPVEIESIGLRFSTYPVSYKGEFRCSDEKLNRIWDVGRYTVQLNMDDGFTDCPWRERGQWMGDARVEGLVAFYAFGDSRLLKRALRLIAQSQTGDGLTYGIYPSAIDFRLPSFTLLWINSIWDYYMHTGDAGFLRELYPNIARALEFFERWIDPHGLIADLQQHYWVFIDWTPMDNRGEMTTINCFYVGTLEVAARMADALGNPAEGQRLRGLAARTRRAIRERLWDSQKHVFADCRTAQGLSKTVSQPANALAILYGIAPEGAERVIFDYIFSPDNRVVPVGSPYFSFYLLGALYRTGMHDRALEYIRAQWSRMLDAGATTWWEAWDGRESLCHGWSAGPTYDLMAEFAGIQPLAPGFKTVLVRPHPAGLEHAAAKVPSSRGDIAVSWRVAGDRFALDLELPAGASARLSLPKLRPDWNAVRADGKPVPGVSGAPSRLELDWSMPGKHSFLVSRGRG